MASDYLPVGILILLATALAFLIVLISILFGPKRHAQKTKRVQPYESGMQAIGPGQRRLPVRFYLVAVLFILFDIEIIFFYPWAVALRALGPGGFLAMLSFMTILVVGFVWVWKKGALEWESMDK
ncbi:MAG: NADH-quinone oxidoreductase subunit A [Thermoflexales bacterium]|nr:NADH-quinone oxidoreductase subunit A [Thermoflexales bacterium]